MLASPRFPALRSRFIALLLAIGAAHALQAQTEIEIEGKVIHATRAETSENGKSLVLYVRERDFPELPRVIGGLRNIRIPLQDGQSLIGRRSGAGSRTREGGVYQLASFGAVPVQDKKIVVSFEFAGQEYRLAYENPGFRESLPQWHAQPLPAVWSNEDYRVSLENIDLVPNQQPAVFGLEPEFRWLVQWRGNTMPKAFSVRCRVEDCSGQGGLLGVSAWKLHCSIGRSHWYPFAAGDLQWFGHVDANRARTIPAGEADMMVIPPEWQKRGLLWAGLFGPGIYVFEDGKLIERRLRTEETRTVPTVSEDESSGRVTIHNDRTQVFRATTQSFHKLDSGWHEFWRGDDGQPLFLGGQGTYLKNSIIHRHELWTVREKSVDYGMAYYGPRTSFEMVVPPPKAR